MESLMKKDVNEGIALDAQNFETIISQTKLVEWNH
jgi:hypothetical protein